VNGIPKLHDCCFPELKSCDACSIGKGLSLEDNGKEKKCNVINPGDTVQNLILEKCRLSFLDIY
jgi:hypothetical protein